MHTCICVRSGIGQCPSKMRITFVVASWEPPFSASKSCQSLHFGFGHHIHMSVTVGSYFVQLMLETVTGTYMHIIDSLPRERNLYSDALKRLRKAIQPFYCEWTKGQNFKPEIRYPNSTDAKQTNLFDCGVYTLMNMELEMKNQHVDHTHNWWFEKYGRDKIAITLLKGHLIDYLI